MSEFSAEFLQIHSAHVQDGSKLNSECKEPISKQAEGTAEEIFKLQVDSVFSPRIPIWRKFDRKSFKDFNLEPLRGLSPL